jgi:hypothetical protein
MGATVDSTRFDSSRDFDLEDEEDEETYARDPFAAGLVAEFDKGKGKADSSDSTIEEVARTSSLATAEKSPV